MQQLKQLISTSKGIVITTHKSPDGDAIGSSLGLYNFLKQFNTHVTVVVPDAFPDFLNWMPLSNEIIYYDTATEKAKELIQYDEMNFSEIAYELGYNNINHLSGQFKQVTGMSMSEYKQLNDKPRLPLDKIL